MTQQILLSDLTVDGAKYHNLWQKEPQRLLVKDFKIESDIVFLDYPRTSPIVSIAKVAEGIFVNINFCEYQASLEDGSTLYIYVASKTRFGEFKQEISVSDKARITEDLYKVNEEPIKVTDDIDSFERSVADYHRMKEENPASIPAIVEQEAAAYSACQQNEEQIIKAMGMSSEIDDSALTE